MKALYYGDNLQVLRASIATESVDLVYLDRARYGGLSRSLRAIFVLIQGFEGRFSCCL